MLCQDGVEGVHVDGDSDVLIDAGLHACVAHHGTGLAVHTGVYGDPTQGLTGDGIDHDLAVNHHLVADGDAVHLIASRVGHGITGFGQHQEAWGDRRTVHHHGAVGAGELVDARLASVCVKHGKELDRTAHGHVNRLGHVAGVGGGGSICASGGCASRHGRSVRGLDVGYDGGQPTIVGKCAQTQGLGRHTTADHGLGFVNGDTVRIKIGPPIDLGTTRAQIRHADRSAIVGHGEVAPDAREGEGAGGVIDLVQPLDDLHFPHHNGAGGANAPALNRHFGIAQER